MNIKNKLMKILWKKFQKINKKKFLRTLKNLRWLVGKVLKNESHKVEKKNHLIIFQ